MKKARTVPNSRAPSPPASSSTSSISSTLYPTKIKANKNSSTNNSPIKQQQQQIFSQKVPQPLLSVFQNHNTSNSSPSQLSTNSTNLLSNDQFSPYLNRKLEMRKGKRYINKSVLNSPRFDDNYINNNNNNNNYVNSNNNNNSFKKIITIEKYQEMENVFDSIASSCLDQPLHELVEKHLKSTFKISENSKDSILFFYDIPSVQSLYCPSSSIVCPHGSGLVGYCHFSRKLLNINNPKEHVSFSTVYDIKGDGCILLFPLFDYQNRIKAVVEIYKSNSINNKTNNTNGNNDQNNSNQKDQNNSNNNEFGKDDEEFVEYFTNKVRLYSKFLFDAHLNEKLVSELAQAQRMDFFTQNTSSKLNRLFNCKTTELWVFDQDKNEIKMYPNRKISLQFSGIVGYSLKKLSLVSLTTSNTHSAFCTHTDGTGDQSIIVVPVKDPKSTRVFGIALRGKKFPHFFTDLDEQLILKIAPIIISALVSSEVVEENFKGIEESTKTQERLQSLLSVAEVLSGQLHIDELIPSIMNKACQLVNADRCSLFIVNESHEKLVSFFHGGLENSLEIPINAGIVGFTATTGKSLNIKDAYDDPRFNRQTDMETGYKTQTLLCVPIFDEKGGIRGVTEMINKREDNGKHFTDDDEKLIQVFNIFCGISIENARLYRASIDLSMQLRSVLEISQSISQNTSNTLKKLLEEILKNARKVVGAGRAMIYLANNNNNNNNSNNNGGNESIPPKNSNKTEVFAIDEDVETKLRTQQNLQNESTSKKLFIKKLMISSSIVNNNNNKNNKNKNNNDNPNNAEDISNEKENMNRLEIINRALKDRECHITNDEKNPYQSMIVVPIIGSDRSILGALLMQWKKRSTYFTYDDQKLLEGFAVFISISLERSLKQESISLGELEISIRENMSESERQMTKAPKNLLFNESELKKVKQFNFSAKFVNDIKLALWIFKDLDVKNESVYSFSYLVRELNSEKNWIKCLEKAQFLIMFSDSGNIIPKNKSSAICNNLNPNLDKAENLENTQITINSIKTNKKIQKNTNSVTELNNQDNNNLSKFEVLQILIVIMSQTIEFPDFNYLNKIDAITSFFKNSKNIEQDYHSFALINLFGKMKCSGFFKDNKDNWDALFELMKCTSMANVVSVLDEVISNERTDEKWFLNNRLLLLKLITICVNVSHLSRPYEIADNNLDKLSNDFFKYGDVTHTVGMVYSNQMQNQMQNQEQQNNNNFGNNQTSHHSHKKREFLVKDESRAGFVQNVCMLAFQKAGKIFPAFGMGYEQMKQNLNVWQNKNKQKKEEDIRNQSQNQNQDQSQDQNQNQSQNPIIESNVGEDLLK